MSATRPGPLQRIGYLLGRPLPTSMREWVKNDVTGPGNTRRYIVRGLVPFIPIAVGLAFIPGPWFMKALMILLLLIPLIYFQIALKNVYRRHLLRNNGLDESLAQTHKIQRLDTSREDFERRYRQLD